MNILMPQLGETVAEGTIATWHKKPGDAVKVDEILIDVETDKVATEIPAPADGVLAEILVKEGETVAVGTVLAILRTEGEAPAVTSGPAPMAPQASAGAKVAGPRTARAARSTDASTPLSPAVKHLLAEHNLDPAMITGSGRDGRVKRVDVLQFLELQATGTVRTPVTRSAASTDNESFIPFNRLRRVTAEHMVRSKATSAHVLQAVEVDFSRVARTREKHAAAWKHKHGYALTWLPFIARAVCLALREFPRLNASVEKDGLRLHPAVNLAIAVDLDHDGLLAPVIKAADQLTVAGLATRIDELAGKARAGKISNDDLAGGTYTISNSGSFGTLITAPIINQPQVAILSTDGIKMRPVVVSGPDGDTIAIHPVGILAQSFDHRAIDGAYSAAFLRRVQTILEQTEWESEL